MCIKEIMQIPIAFFWGGGGALRHRNWILFSSPMFSAKDEKEVAQCIMDLNSPSFYPSMVSLWVTDSFERKDMERELLTKLLVNLSKPQSGMLSQHQLIKG